MFKPVNFFGPTVPAISLSKVFSLSNDTFLPNFTLGRCRSNYDFIFLEGWISNSGCFQTSSLLARPPRPAYSIALQRAEKRPSELVPMDILAAGAFKTFSRSHAELMIGYAVSQAIRSPGGLSEPDEALPPSTEEKEIDDMSIPPAGANDSPLNDARKTLDQLLDRLTRLIGEIKDQATRETYHALILSSRYVAEDNDIDMIYMQAEYIQTLLREHGVVVITGTDIIYTIEDMMKRFGRERVRRVLAKLSEFEKATKQEVITQFIKLFIEKPSSDLETIVSIFINSNFSTLKR